MIYPLQHSDSEVEILTVLSSCARYYSPPCVLSLSPLASSSYITNPQSSCNLDVTLTKQKSWMYLPVPICL